MTKTLLYSKYVFCFQEDDDASDINAIISAGAEYVDTTLQPSTKLRKFCSAFPLTPVRWTESGFPETLFSFDFAVRFEWTTLVAQSTL